MIAPERIWIAEDEIGNPWWSTARDDEMDEYIRADLAPPPAKVRALVEAAKIALDDLDEWVACKASLESHGFNMDDTAKRAEILRAALAALEEQ